MLLFTVAGMYNVLERFVVCACYQGPENLRIDWEKVMGEIMNHFIAVGRKSCAEKQQHGLWEIPNMFVLSKIP